MRSIMVLAALAALCGCAFNARVLPMNDAALGTPVASFEYVRQGMAFGPVIDLGDPAVMAAAGNKTA